MAQLLRFTQRKQSPLSLSAQFYTYTPNGGLSCDECLKDTHNYREMRVFIILPSPKPNAKRAGLVKRTLVLFAIMLHYASLHMSPSVREKFSHSRVFSPVEKLPRFTPAPPCPPPPTTTTITTTHTTSKRGHTETSSPFWQCPPTSRSSNYSSYKTSTLLLVKPQYNNTTKHFKETTHISREK